MKKTTRRKRSTPEGGAGGVYPADPSLSPEDRVEQFLANAQIEPLSMGSNGVTLLATLPPGVPSPFLSMVPREFGKEVRSLVLKYCVLTERAGGQIQLRDHRVLMTASPQNFQDEVNAQTDAFNCTVHNLYPLCPAIVFADILDSQHLQLLRLAGTNPVIRTMLQEVVNRQLRYGIIVMELAQGYTTLYDWVEDHPDNDGLFLMFAMLLRLARECGYAHNDFHQSNFMLKQMQSQLQGQLIDFGFARKLTPREQTAFNALYDAGNYEGALEFLCNNLTRKDDFVFRSHSAYEDVCHPSSLHGFSNEAIQQVLDTMQQVQQQRNPRTLDILRTTTSGLPSLPLPQEFRARLYPGLSKHVPQPELPAPSVVLVDPLAMEAFTKVVQRTLSKAPEDKKVEAVAAVLRAWRYKIYHPAVNLMTLKRSMLAFLVCEGAVLASSIPPEAQSMLEPTAENLCGQMLPRSFLDFLTPSGRAALNRLSTDELVHLLVRDRRTFEDPAGAAATLNDAPSSSPVQQQQLPPPPLPLHSQQQLTPQQPPPFPTAHTPPPAEAPTTPLPPNRSNVRKRRRVTFQDGSGKQCTRRRRRRRGTRRTFQRTTRKRERAA